MEKRLVAIGDSITLGHWDPGGGWVARIRRRSDEDVLASRRERYAAVYNLGISSNTSKHVRERYLPETTARFTKTEKERAFVALAVGINDSRLEGGRETTGLDEYRQNLREIVKQGQDEKHRIVVVGLTPVDEELSDPVRWDEKKSFRNERIAEFDAVARAVADEHGLEFADLLGAAGLDSAHVHLDWDGLHLNPVGHERVALVVEKALRRAGWGPSDQEA